MRRNGSSPGCKASAHPSVARAMAAPDGLLAQLSLWHKDGIQRLTTAVDKHKAVLSQLIQQAEAEILELVQPFEDEKPRTERRARGKQQVRVLAQRGAWWQACAQLQAAQLSACERCLCAHAVPLLWPTGRFV